MSPFSLVYRMRNLERSIIRHLLAAFSFALALLGAFIPIFQGWVFFLIAVLILALEYRWVRNVALRPLYRRNPAAYRRITRFRRRNRIRCARFFRRLTRRGPEPISAPPQQSVNSGKPKDPTA